MAVRMRRWIVIGLVIVLLIVIGGFSAIGWAVVLGPKARPVTARKFEATDARRARGQYLVENVASCFHCHSPHDLTNPELPILAGKKGAGWEMPIPEIGTISALNITPDPDTGIGRWTDDEVARAIQEGVDRNGAALFPVMPYMNFRNLDDEDLASIVVYLRSIPPVRNPTPAHQLIFPLKYLVNTMPQPLTTHAAAPARTTPEARGEYLVLTVAGCQDCHTPIDDKGQPLPNMDFGGGALFHDPSQNGKEVFSANITPDPSGIQYYDEQMFIDTLRSGATRGRMLNHIMPFENFRNMTDDDLKDIWAYIKSRPPVKHRVSNVDPPTKCPICNQTHGLGELNLKPAK